MNKTSLWLAPVAALALSLLACSGGDDTGEQSAPAPSASNASSSAGSTCSHAKTHLASCTTDSDCYSGNCDRGSCYVGTQNCTTKEDCAGLAPNSAYLTACINDSVKHGCAVYCTQ